LDSISLAWEGVAGEMIAKAGALAEMRADRKTIVPRQAAQGFLDDDARMDGNARDALFSAS
jgi:hypothetical protein